MFGFSVAVCGGHQQMLHIEMERAEVNEREPSLLDLWALFYKLHQGEVIGRCLQSRPALSFQSAVTVQLEMELEVCLWKAVNI